jgi:hypothetical protein
MSSMNAMFAVVDYAMTSSLCFLTEFMAGSCDREQVGRRRISRSRPTNLAVLNFDSEAVDVDGFSVDF